jgi:ATP-dependent Clp protease protease subunit
METKTTDSNLVWVKEFSDDALKSFYEEFMELEKTENVGVIPIVISSYGGEVSALLAMRDIIKSSHKPVSTIALGKAMSSGACLLAAGTKGLRYASPDTIIMIHEVSTGVVGKAADIKETAETVQMLNRKLLANLASDCGIPLSKLDAYMHSTKNADWNMTAQEAKKLGIVDKVAVPRIFNTPGHLMLGIPSGASQAADMSPKKGRSSKGRK